MDNPIKIIIGEKPKPNWREIILALFSYLGVLIFIPIILKAKGEFIEHHRKQGIALLGIEVISTFIILVPFIGWLIGLTGWLLSAVLSITGLVNVSQKRYWTAPLLLRLSNKMNHLF